MDGFLLFALVLFYVAVCYGHIGQARSHSDDKVSTSFSLGDLEPNKTNEISR
jgi:hypothetical protein